MRYQIIVETMQDGNKRYLPRVDGCDLFHTWESLSCKKYIRGTDDVWLNSEQDARDIIEAHKSKVRSNTVLKTEHINL